MLPQFEITIDKQDLANLEEVFKDAPHKLNKVLYRGINDGIKKMQSLTVKAVSAETGIKQKIVRTRVWLNRATARRLAGSVRGGRHGWPLGEFSPVQKAPGVEVKVGRRSLVERAFIATMDSGHTGVFIRRHLGPVAMPRLQKPAIARRDRAKSTRRRGRLPIDERYTASATDAIERAAAAPAIIEEGAAVLHKRIMAQAELIFTGKRR